MSIYDFCPLCGVNWEDHEDIKCFIKLFIRQPLCFKRNLGYMAHLCKNFLIKKLVICMS